MPETKKRSPRFLPIDDSHEWIYFDWEHLIIIRQLERSVAKSVEYAMPDEFKIENGCIVRRLDTNEIVEFPLSVCRFSIAPKLVFIDLFDDRSVAFVACEVVPAKRKPKPKPKSSVLTPTKSVGKIGIAKAVAKKKSGLLF